MRCEIHCPEKGSGAVAAVVVALAAGLAAWAALGLAAPFLIPFEAVALAAAVAARAGLLRLSPVLQRTAAPALRSGPLAHKLAAARARPVPPRMRDPRRAAITTGQRAIEGKIVPGWAYREVEDDVLAVRRPRGAGDR